MTRGFLRFDVAPGDGEVLLDFPVAGRPVVVSQGGSTCFSGIAPADPGP